MHDLQFVFRDPVLKGWSSDRKYRVVRPDGSVALLRIASVTQYERKKLEYEMMQRAAALGVPMSRPIAFGVCGEGVYTLLSWTDGEDAETVIPRLSEAGQYAYGLTAGQILNKLHTIPAPPEQEPWEPRFNRKMDRKIQNCRACPIGFDGAEDMIAYIESNRSLLANRPQSYQHGDYHIGNMMLDAKGTLTIIDFNRFDFGDPWEEFNRIVWCAQASPRFASGLVDGYFSEGVPELFWKLLLMYISSNTLSSIPWAIPFGPAQVEIMKKQARTVMEWYDGLRRTVPSWYARPEDASL